MSLYLLRYQVPFGIGTADVHERSIAEILAAADRFAKIDAWVGTRGRDGVTRVYATADTLEDATALELATSHLDPNVQELS